MTSTFTDKVLRIVSKIPKGKTLTYKQVAFKAGNVKASRAVGTIMRKNYNSKIPCHRVVRSDGKPGNYNRGGSSEKVRILKSENPNYLGQLKIDPRLILSLTKKSRV